MQILILCGGLATRLGDIARDTPKSMIKIEGKPFLEYQIENLKKNSIEDIVLCVGHLYESIKDYFGDGKDFGVNIKYSYDGKKPLGPIGAVKNAKKFLENVFFIMYGDSYLRFNFKDAYDYFSNENKLGLMVVYKNNDKYDKSNIAVNGNQVIAYMNEKNSNNLNYIDYGSSILRKETLELIPNDSYFSTGELFSELINRNELLAYEVKKRFYHIGNPVALKEFKEFIRSK